MIEKVPAKERALNAARIARIGREVRAALPAFDPGAFTADVMADLPNLELTARIARVAQGLHDHLPVSGAAALDVLRRSLPATPQDAGITNDFGLHLYSPHSAFVAQYCLTEQDLGAALEALGHFTRYFSAEGAVRYFLNVFPEQTMAAVAAWARDEDYRVRRLASEATRPVLPWSIRINLPSDAALPVLDELHADPSRFVTQSVANHLRDITAAQPGLVIATLKRWREEGRAAPKELTFITREALRTKLKEGWPPAYELLGFDPGVNVDATPLQLDRSELTAGETLSFSSELTSSQALPVHVMYVITSTTRTGRRREKVYFLTRGTIPADRPLTVSKQHVLRSTATATITPGQCSIAIQVNGRRHPATPFQVRAQTIE